MTKPHPTRTTGEKYPTKGVVHEHVRHMLLIERMCARFHRVARQLQSRHDHRATLHVADEYDLRDLLHALLLLEYDDIRPEAWTPDYADGTPRIDFLLKLEQIVIAARQAQPGFGTKELAAQLPLDIEHYRQHPDCRTLVCFVYDPDGRIAYPRGLERELSGDRAGLTVRVIIAPKGL
jgi:hypothetical protein